MMNRVEAQFDIKPERLIGDTAYRHTVRCCKWGLIKGQYGRLLSVCYSGHFRGAVSLLSTVDRYVLAGNRTNTQRSYSGILSLPASSAMVPAYLVIYALRLSPCTLRCAWPDDTWRRIIPIRRKIH